MLGSKYQGQGHQLTYNDQEANLEMALNQALKKEFSNSTVLLNAVTWAETVWEKKP